MTKLLVFGDTDAPMFQIISEASHQVDWVEAWPLAAFKTQIRRHAGAQVIPLLLGCNYTRFIAFYNEVILQEQFHRPLSTFASRGVVLCDSVKPFWKQFVKDNGGLFTRLYPIDMPNGLFANRDTQNFRPIIGMPIGHWIDPSRLQPERMHLLSFAGATHLYPERQQFIDALNARGITVALVEAAAANASCFDQYRNVGYSRYLDFLLHSLLTINFPQATSNSGAGLHIKGRYWEALATGSVVLEQRNSLAELLSPKPRIVNYVQPDEIAAIVDSYRARSQAELVEEKLSQVVEFKGIFDAATYFEQFLR